MEQFNLDTWLKDKSRKVVTRLKKSVQIISIEGKEDIPIVALVEGVAHQYKPNGYHADVVVAYSNQCRDMGDYDLFFADEEGEPQSIEIPFGAKDSEFIRDEYLIPEGCEARIEGNKIIIEKIQKEELTEFEKELINLVFKYKYWDSSKDKVKQGIKKDSKLLLDLARKEILKDLPKWKKCIGSTGPFIDYNSKDEAFLYLNDYVIKVSELEKLPKEE